MIIIQQTGQPTAAGSHQDVNIFDASANALTSTAGALNISDGITASSFLISTGFTNAAFVALAAGACKKVVIANYTGVTILVSKNAGANYMPVPNNGTLCVSEITNANQVSQKRGDAVAVSVNSNYILYN